MSTRFHCAGVRSSPSPSSDRMLSSLGFISSGMLTSSSLSSDWIFSLSAHSFGWIPSSPSSSSDRIFHHLTFSVTQFDHLLLDYQTEVPPSLAVFVEAYFLQHRVAVQHLAGAGMFHCVFPMSPSFYCSVYNRGCPP